MKNPFAVFSPEGLNAKEVVDLFIEASPGVDSIQTDGHAMLLGPRGAGKSMILRYMEPDCQRIALRSEGIERQLCDLPYYSAYITIRETELSLPFLALVEQSHAAVPLNEHILVLTIALSALRRSLKNDHFSVPSNVSKTVVEEIVRLHSMHSRSSPAVSLIDVDERSVIKFLADWLADEHEYAIDYFNGLITSSSLPPFERKLFRFQGFLTRLITLIKEFPSMPRSARFFLSIDDADRLSTTQARILNTWLSRRNNDFSLKVSYEMYGYKTFYTNLDTRIEAPHDYQEIRVSDVYTSNKKTSYRDRMRQMIGRRLATAGIAKGKHEVPDVDRFFAEDHAQSVRVERLREQKKAKLLQTGGRSARLRDDLYRYVLPEYISSLGGSRKSRSQYRYSGFDQLVDISSGVPRYFLEAAQKMYDRQLVRTGPYAAIREIAPEVQDSVVRDLASDLFMEELEKLKMDPDGAVGGDVALKLHNLIGCLGALFEKIQNDPNASERRVFSFALSDYPDPEVEAVLRLGLRHAFFSRSSIGRKEGFGRTERYVLSRRFAPYWNLDPSGFSAYKFMTNAEMREMMLHPNRHRLSLRRRGADEDQLEIILGDEGAE